jgi:N-acetyl-anhydromuramyl-L-alanine amidase AmpD
MIIVHATAARGPGDLNYLRQGGSESRVVSSHYYIDRAGIISQMVEDKNIAYDAGTCTWKIDDKSVQSCNTNAIHIELENLNIGRDTYPQPQYDAVVKLVRYLATKYFVPRNQVVRHLDVAPGHKTDPAGFPWARFIDDAFSSTTNSPP